MTQITKFVTLLGLGIILLGPAGTVQAQTTTWPCWICRATTTATTTRGGGTATVTPPIIISTSSTPVSRDSGGTILTFSIFGGR